MSIDDILQDAKLRIFAGSIQCGGQLTAYLHDASTQLGIASENLFEAAVRHGLFRSLGKQYQQKLDRILGLVRKELDRGQIATAEQLIARLKQEATNVPCCTERRVDMDLIVDARRAGLFLLLSETQAAPQAA